MCLTPSVLNDKKTPAWIRTELEKEWRKEGGHPDAEYTTKRWKGFNRKEELYDKSLIGLLNTPKQEQPHIPRELSPEEPIGKPYEPPFPRQKIHFKFPSNRLIVFLIIVAAVAYFVFFVPQETKNNVLLTLEKTKNSFIDGIKNIGSVSNSLVNIESVSKNPEEFAGKNITISGKYAKNFATFEEFLIDEQGYKVRIECGNTGRVFQLGEEYRTSGILLFNEICGCQNRYVYNITEDDWKEITSKHPEIDKKNLKPDGSGRDYILLPSSEEGWEYIRIGISNEMESYKCNSSSGFSTNSTIQFYINSTHNECIFRTFGTPCSYIEGKTAVIEEKRCNPNSIRNDYYLQCL